MFRRLGTKIVLLALAFTLVTAISIGGHTVFISA